MTVLDEKSVKINKSAEACVNTLGRPNQLRWSSMGIVPLKRCCRCGVEKPTEAFNRSKSCADGRYYACRDCQKLANSIYKSKNRDKINTDQNAKRNKDFRPEVDLPHEVWRSVIGYEHDYLVSNLGRVQTNKKHYAGGTQNGRLLSSSLNNQGYPRVSLTQRGKTKQVFVHRLVAEAFLGVCPNGYQVHHADADRANPRLDNLEYVTAAQNIKYVHSMGNAVVKRGIEKATSKLNDESVREIRSSLLTNRELAKKYGVNDSTISAVRLRKKWRHVT